MMGGMTRFDIPVILVDGRFLACQCGAFRLESSALAGTRIATESLMWIDRPRASTLPVNLGLSNPRKDRISPENGIF